MKGQSDVTTIAMRLEFLEEIERIFMTRGKSENYHKYSTIAAIEESVHEILVNFKETALRSNL